MKIVKSEIRITPGKKVWSKWVEARKDPNKPWFESSGLSPREGNTQSKSRTNCAKICGWSSGFLDLIRVSSLQHVQLASANFADLNSRWNSDTISCHVVPPEELHKTKDLKNRCGIRDTSQVWRKVSTNTVFEKTQWCRAGTGKQH